MRDTVDKRVVELELDNKKFNKNVDSSTERLNKLNEALEFRQVAKSIDKIESKFNHTEVWFRRKIENLSDTVTNFEKRLIKSLSIDQIATGWDKFGQKTKAVATLMSQTLKIAGKEITNTSEKMEVITEQLEKLSFFSDETSYSFTDMVDNMGKFTAAGISLDQANKSMMGIANWAALSGQNAATASRAMYQLSQALGRGYIQLIDWKSIQNANMDTQEFRQTALDTAVALGELTKEGQNYISKTGSKFTINQFTEQLNSKWFTSDVLNKTLERYSSAVDKLFEITEREGISAYEAMEKYADQFDSFGLKAMKAAQECRTLSDAINAIKDAVASNWMNSFELIFGKYGDAKTFWSDISNELYEAFVTAGQFRNEVLEVWNELEGRSTLFAHDPEHPEKQGAFWNIVDSITALKQTIKDSWNTVFPKSELEDDAGKAAELAGWLKRITTHMQNVALKIRTTIEQSDKIKRTLTGLGSVLRFIAETATAFIRSLEPVIYLLRSSLGWVTEKIAQLGDFLSGSDKLMNNVYNITNKITVGLENLFNKIMSKGTLDRITNFFDKIVEAGRKVIDFIKHIASEIKKFFQSLKGTDTLATDNKKGKSKKTNNTGNLLDGVAAFFAKIKEKFMGSEFGQFSIKLFEAFYSLLKAALSLVKAIGNLLVSLINFVSALIESLSKWMNNLSGKLQELSENEEKIKELLKKILAGALVIAGIFVAIKVLLEIVWARAYIKANIGGALMEFSDALNKYAWGQIVKSISESLKWICLGILAVVGSAYLLQNVNQNGFDNALKIFIAFAVFLTAYTVIVSLLGKASKSIISKDKQTGKFSSQSSNVYSIMMGVNRFLLAFSLGLIGIAKAIQMMAEADLSSEDMKELRNIVLPLAGIFSLTFLLAQLINKIGSKKGGFNANVEISLFKYIAFIAAIGLLIRFLKEVATNENLQTVMSSTKFMVSMVAFFGAMFLVLVAISGLGKMKSKATGTASMSVTGNNFALINKNPIGSIIASVAFLIASISAALIIITNVMKTTDLETLKSVAWWLIGAVGAILVIASVVGLVSIGMQKATKLAAGSNSKTDAKDSANVTNKNKTVNNIFNRNRNPVVGMIIGVAFLLMSISIALGVCATVMDLYGPGELLKILGVLTGFIVLLTGVLTVFTAFMRDTEKKKGQLKTGGTSKKAKMSDNNPIAWMLAGLSALIISISVAVAIMSLLPDKRVDKLLIALGVIVGALVALIGIFAVINSKLNAKTTKRITNTTSIIRTVVIALIGLMAGVILLATIGKSENTNLIIAACAGITGVLLAIVAVVAILGKMKSAISGGLKAAGAIALISVGILALLSGIGLGMYILAWGLERLVPIMNELTDSGVSSLLILLAGLAGISLISILGILNSSLAVGMETLAWGLERLVPIMNQLESSSVDNLRYLLYQLSIIGVAGVLGIVGNSSLGVGMEVLGWGLERLVTPMNKLTSASVDNLIHLLYQLSITGVAGLLGIIGNSSLGTGMETLGWGLERLVTPMKQITLTSVENLEKLLDVLCESGRKGIVSFMGNNSLTAGITNLGKAFTNLFGSLSGNQNEKALSSFATIIGMAQELGDNEFVIRPVIDLTKVNEGIAAIRSAFANIANPTLSLASDASRIVTAGNNGTNNTNNTNNYNDSTSIVNNFTINGNNPREIAEEIDKYLKKQSNNYRLAKGVGIK